MLSVQSNSNPVSKFNGDESPVKSGADCEGIALESKTYIDNKAQIYHMAEVEPVSPAKEHAPPLDEVELERSRTHSARSVDLPSDPDEVKEDEIV